MPAWPIRRQQQSRSIQRYLNDFASVAPESATVSWWSRWRESLSDAKPCAVFKIAARSLKKRR